MKICWLGGTELTGRGVLIVEAGAGFRAVGPGQVAEVSDERGELLIAKGLASPDLSAGADLAPLSGEELQDLEATAEEYTAAHALVLESLARRRAIEAKVRES